MLTKSGNEYELNAFGEGMYSISFGNLTTTTSGGKTVTKWSKIADTWDTWHLIPSTRHAISQPAPTFKFIEVPGSSEIIDMSAYLTGKLEYGRRSGTLSFIVDPGYEHWTKIQESMLSVLHGKKLKMRLSDDPQYYYEGYFTVGNWETGERTSQISITYQLNPYKIRIDQNGDTEIIWDTFNFDKDSFSYPRGGSLL